MNPITHRPLSAITVAGIIFREERFLLVKELIEGQIKLNQPAGHVEPGESLIEAVKREVLEETRYHFHPEALLGVYHHNPAAGHRIMRIAIIGSVDPSPDLSLPLDAAIHSTEWRTAEEIIARQAELRSPFVLSCIEDFQQGQCFDLAVLHSLTGIRT
ncbi:MAG: hypothetical protein B7X35_05245 [Halothiobacillus sp. 14-56-357]|jgi:8-oxo-dGTP pyrophosphatase MutT (NUDIX family)|uniref:NUDIX hydrolase n=1 Tax=Halothiobacillus sp. 15-55-196 TaxID=1970382 RepID=UPI000BD038D0|nr:NUDIX hydrolase [Halothiobacillus sp. 15-55-196]OZB37138.1 MAG: hypothetical protein B7X44_02925 [Halothiobacillus sp. 15-55-196]OZB56502.1 MAG: hypothetical protein B7X35_05245 [Halothiobacillus sp. 14-56-357]OZB77917.1 MAG: hypothetical protein B7X29_06865 [Halothiobacillus sp. 13-55-115]